MKDAKKLNAGIAFLCLQNLDDQNCILGDYIQGITILADRTEKTELYNAGLESDPTPAAQAEDSVLEDAVLLKEARDALWQPANVALCERIDAYLDAARKQGANHDRTNGCPQCKQPDKKDPS